MIALTAALASCSPRGVDQPARAPSPGGTGYTETARVLARLRRVLEAFPGAERAWPGFALRSQVLLATAGPDGPVYLIGDANPPTDFRWVDRRNLVAIREGTPPDSLRTGLRLAMDWNGRRGIATAIEFDADDVESLPTVLVHEAFHTHQEEVHARSPDRFVGRPNPAIPDTAVEAVALLDLEGGYLARSVRAGDVSEKKRLALTALAVRGHRCLRAEETECALERAIEQNEGTAEYVTAAALGASAGNGRAGAGQDALAEALSPIVDPARLKRWHFYDTGHAWLLLLARFGHGGWQDEVEKEAPDRVLARALGASPASMEPLLQDALRSAAWADAYRAANALRLRTIARRDSAERAFFGRAGIPLRVYFGRVTQVSTAQRSLPDGRVERTIHFDGNRVVFRGDSRPICCPGEMTIAPVAGRTATVGGREIPLDRDGTTAAGAVSLDLPELSLRFTNATVGVFRDSITVRAQ